MQKIKVRRVRECKKKIILFAVLALILWFWFSLPRNLFPEPTSYVMEDREGNLLSATVSVDGQWRFPARTDVPIKFEKCILAYEDKRFYSHPGIDIISLGRAIRQNFSAKRVVSGGSTITMQVVRLSRKKGRNLFQKAVEMILALRAELRYSKKEILALYASHAPFGGNVVGLDAAAWRYFGRSPDLLSWGEAAVLAVLPNSPSLIHPGKNRDILKKKRDTLLYKLRKQNVIDELTYLSSIDEPLPGAPKPLPELSPHLLNKYRKDNQKKSQTASTRIQTTLDKKLQEQVIQIGLHHMNHLRENNINNMAILVMEIESGDVLAYMGNIFQPQYPETESYVDIIQSPRSPGSLLKPLLFAASQYDGITLPHAMLPDIPTQIGGYMPQNFYKTYDGAVPASEAISRSLNIPAVRLLRQYKYPRFYSALQQGGISTINNPADHYGLSLILGGCEITMWEVAGLYASLARAYLHAHNEKGNLNQDDFFMPNYTHSLQHHVEDQSKMQFPTDVVSLWHMFHAMEEVNRPGEESFWQLSGTARRIAWKTGTSFGFRDAWSLGFSSRHLVAVWVGNADGEGRPGIIGLRAAAPVMFDVFHHLPESQWFEAPKTGYIYLPICTRSGFKAGRFCESTKEMMVSPSGVRTDVCPYHIQINMHPSLPVQVNESCFSPLEMHSTSWFVLPPSMEYYYRQIHPSYKLLPPLMNGCETLQQEKKLALQYPVHLARIYIPIELTGKKGEMICQAVHKKPKEILYWHLDGMYVGKTEIQHNMPLQPDAGWHTLTVVDESGEKITCRFEVIKK